MIIQKFESFSDEFDEARFNISDGDSYLFFYFGGQFIGNPKGISDLIDYYKKSYMEKDEWVGGPVNQDFCEYFKKKYQTRWTSFQLSKCAKPSIALFVISDLGTMIMSFDIWKYHSFSVFQVLQNNEEELRELSNQVKNDENIVINSNSPIIQRNSWVGEDMPYVSQMNKLWRSFYDGRKTIFEVKEFFGLDPRGWDIVFGGK